MSEQTEETAATVTETVVENETVGTIEVTTETTVTGETTSEQPTETEPKVMGLDDVKKRYFSPDTLEDAVAYVNLVSAIEGIKVQTNFDMADPNALPDGYGLAILPINQRLPDGKGNQTIGVAIAAIPDPATVGLHEKGEDFIRSIITDVLCARVTNAVRPRADGSVAGTIPFKIEDFLESQRGRESLKAFSAIAGIFVKALRRKGLKLITSQSLRTILQSATFAQSQFAKIPQAKWETLLHAMIGSATKLGHDPAVLKNWLETRNETEAQEIEDIDFGDLVELS